MSSNLTPTATLINITTENNTEREKQVKTIVKYLSERYEVPIFTKKVVIEEGAIPHSHPTLTLNTRVLDKRLILKTLVHEQFHWYVSQHKNAREALHFLQKEYKMWQLCDESDQDPKTYFFHIIICFNTQNWLQKHLAAEDVTWIYNQQLPYPTLENLIAENFETVQSDLQKFDIIY